MGVERFLVDKSVHARLRQQAVRDVVSPLSDRGALVACAMVEMELLFSARNAADKEIVRQKLRAFEWLVTPDEVWDRATEVQCELVERGEHRTVKIPDLLIAATAERHHVTVLHYDHDYDRIAAVTGQPTRWVVPPGTAD